MFDKPQAAGRAISLTCEQLRLVPCAVPCSQSLHLHPRAPPSPTAWAEAWFIPVLYKAVPDCCMARLHIGAKLLLVSQALLEQRHVEPDVIVSLPLLPEHLLRTLWIEAVFVLDLRRDHKSQQQVTTNSCDNSVLDDVLFVSRPQETRARIHTSSYWNIYWPCFPTAAITCAGSAD